MGFAVAYIPCGWCPYKESGERCAMCELTFRRKEWISVDERLPDGNGRFLIVDRLGGMMVCYWEKRFGWFADVCSKNAITHWMPIPEPPMMKGGAE